MSWFSIQSSIIRKMRPFDHILTKYVRLCIQYSTNRPTLFPFNNNFILKSDHPIKVWSLNRINFHLTFWGFLGNVLKEKILIIIISGIEIERKLKRSDRIFNLNYYNWNGINSENKLVDEENSPEIMISLLFFPIRWKSTRKMFHFINKWIRRFHV